MIQYTFRMQDNGDKIKDTRYRNSGLKIHDRIQYRVQVQNTECRIPITRYKIQDTGHRIHNTRYKIHDSGNKIQGVGYKIHEI